MKNQTKIKPIEKRIFQVPAFRDRKFSEYEKALVGDVAKLAYVMATYDMLDRSQAALDEVCFKVGQLGLGRETEEIGCEHENQYVNDRSQFVCSDCGEELGR